jgi:hypothetical protein
LVVWLRQDKAVLWCAVVGLKWKVMPRCNAKGMTTSSHHQDSVFKKAAIFLLLVMVTGALVQAVPLIMGNLAL